MASHTALAAAPVNGLTIDVATKSEDISRFEGAWQRLFVTAGTEPSTSFEWTVAMLRHHLEPGDRFFLLRASHDGDTAGFVPLVARPHSIVGQRVVVLSPISDRYNTHGSLLVRGLDRPSAETLVAALLRLDVRWDIFRMSKVLEDGPLTSLLEAAARSAARECDVRYGRAAYTLRLPASFDEYLAQRSPKFRNHLKRTARKLQVLGRVVVTEVQTPDKFDDAYEALLNIERASWKQGRGTAISAISRQTGFYRTMGRAALAAGRLHLQVLTLDGVPIAHNVGYLHNGCYFYLKTSYDERHRALGPSTFLRAQLIAGLIERGIRHFDFPGEPYEWERQWTDTYHWHQTVTIYNRTPKGIALRWLHKLKRDPVTRPTLAHCDPLDIVPRRS